MKFLNRMFATFFGIGFFPKAPGTASSLAALFVYILVLHKLSWPWYLLFLMLLFFLGSRASGIYAAELGQIDPPRVVIDEAFGQFLALLLIPTGWLGLAMAFLFFRLFDIIKPYPIRRLEKLPGGWGIMADDAGAGVAAGAVAHFLLLLI
jgi:phosphatidylglycerophosphatase A